MENHPKPLTVWENLFQRKKIVGNLERFQDFIVISLCIGLFCVMLIRLGEMFFSFLQPLDLRQITSDILFILILVELFRLLIDYLQEQKISVGAAVEITIVSALREIILRGVLEIPRGQIFGVSVFLIVLGGLLLILPWISHILASVNIKHIQAKQNTQE
ncbi:phosphate-starvation-inducible PsiE family protein [Calothrix rhizosoleniae]|uniref:phosphate-starvation-inducible PsiE family protein n=1 Tax=Calothrix rhizosoleniae TaxID=888997 RepID=UPI000B49F0D5|nr:phosphate-starvation-inducible PsiE family protein [Calothrix rhizosoleniae]